MPFWKRKEDPELEAARAEAEAVLPAGWEIDYADYESFAIPGGTVRTYGVLALGPGGEGKLVVGVGEADAYRQFARHVRGEFGVEPGWSPPVPAMASRLKLRSFSVWDESDPHVVDAKRELEANLPPGWKLFHNDRERYKFPGGQLEAFGVSAVGPRGEVAFAVGLGEVNSYHQLVRRLRGELPTAEGWAPPTPGVGSLHT